jgi:hypothetical protein
MWKYWKVVDKILIEEKLHTFFWNRILHVSSFGRKTIYWNWQGFVVMVKMNHDKVQKTIVKDERLEIYNWWHNNIMI